MYFTEKNESQLLRCIQTIFMKKSMKIQFIIIIALTSLSFPCKTQTSFAINSSARVENYMYGELDIKVVPFGLGKEIIVGKISSNGNILFNWPELDLSSIKNSAVFFQDIKSTLLGMSFCEDGQIEENTEDPKVVDTQFLYLYKNKKQVGVLFPATQIEMMDNEPANIYADLTLGSSLSWFYSNSTCNFKANCSEKRKWENKYDFTEERSYDIHLKEGWNIVQYTLVEKENWKDENGPGNMEKIVLKKTVDKIPDNIKWHIKTFVKIPTD